MCSQVDIVDLKLDRRGSSDSTKFDHHEIVCPTIGAVNVYLQVNKHISSMVNNNNNNNNTTSSRSSISFAFSFAFNPRDLYYRG